jgi:Fe-S cluster assembly protein SufD
VLARLAPEELPGPDWLADSRRAALAWVAENGFPTAKHEDWRYTRLGPVLALPLEAAGPSTGGLVDAAFLAGNVADLGGVRLVFVNGHYRPDLSTPADLPAGATVLDLAAALPVHRPLLKPVLAGEQPRDAFIAMNGALAPDGVFVHLDRNVVVPEPIHLVFAADTAAGTLLSSPRMVFCLGENSEATIVETHVGVDDAPAGSADADAHCSNVVVDVRLAPDARLTHYKLQDDTPGAYHLASLDVRQSAGSRMVSHLALLGGAVSRQETRVRFDGERAELSLDGLYMPGGRQVHDNTLFIDHVAPNCTSNQLFKGVLSGRGRGVFNGYVMIRQGADGTDAHQTNKNLVLSDGAEADTRPRLEIYADDVKATHGSAVGQLDEDAILYLRARGIPAAQARQVLVRGFVQEMIDRIALAPLRDQLSALLTGRSFGD